MTWSAEISAKSSPRAPVRICGGTRGTLKLEVLKPSSNTSDLMFNLVPVNIQISINGSKYQLLTKLHFYRVILVLGYSVLARTIFTARSTRAAIQPSITEFMTTATSLIRSISTYDAP